MGKVLKAPVDWTGTIVTSEGEVELEGGVAKSYTEKVGDHLVENVPGWRYAVVDDGAAAEAAEDKVEDESLDSSDAPETIDLPVVQDNVKVIRKFAKDHGIDLAGNNQRKKDMLSVIYAHFDRS